MKYISSVHDQNTARGRARNALTARPIATDREHAPPTLVTARGVGHAGAYHPHAAPSAATRHSMQQTRNHRTAIHAHDRYSHTGYSRAAPVAHTYADSIQLAS